MFIVARNLLLANIARYAGQLTIFAIIARVSGPESAGNFALSLAISAPLYILLGLGMRSVYLTLHKDVPFKSYEGLRAVALLAAVVVSLLLVLFLGLEPEAAEFLTVVAFMKALDAFNDLYSAALQKASRSTSLFRVAVLSSAMQILVFAGSAYAGCSLTVCLGISTIVYALVTFLVARRLAVKAQPTMETAIDHAWRAIVFAGLPTGVSFGLITLLSNVPQYFIGWQIGPAEVARYATLMYLVVVGEMLLNALSQAWIPTARKANESGLLSRTAIMRSGAKWMLITVPISALSLVGAAVLLPHVLGPGFFLTLGEALPLAIAMLVAPFVFASATSLAVRNRYRSTLVGSSVALSFTFVLAWFFVENWGVAGGLWAYTVGLVIRAVSALVLVSGNEEKVDAQQA